MEKLEKKHNHKLTDLLKVGIFGIMLLLPFITWMPNAFYYGFNEHAVVGQEETYYNFYQGIKNGKPTNDLQYITTEDEVYEDYLYNATGSFDAYYDTNLVCNNNDKIYYSFIGYTENHVMDIEVQYSNDGSLEITDNYMYGSTDYNGVLVSNVFTNTQNATLTTFNLYGGDGLTGVKDVMIFNLTTIFGSGNEPTKEVFESYLTQDYYNYGNNYILKDKGTNITWSMYNAWEDIWQTPLFNWTNTSILRTGLKNFVNVFGVTDAAYITNLITYELIIVAIYIVIDIVIEIFKWLTHLIGEK